MPLLDLNVLVELVGAATAEALERVLAASEAEGVVVESFKDGRRTAEVEGRRTDSAIRDRELLWIEKPNGGLFTG